MSILVASFVLSVDRRDIDAQENPAFFGYRVVNSYPHDSGAYTQGLVYRDGFLYESTGLNSRSSLRKVRLETGEVLQKQRVDSKYFAEGLADSTFRYAGEGWGLTHDRRRLILSDGTSTLRFIDPSTFREQGRIAVRDGSRPVEQLNELEYVRDEIFANVWHTDRIARISPASGRVTGWIDLTGLLPKTYQLDSEAVLNGIAYDAERDRLFVTGKLWPRLFEIALERGR
ncbi:MAG: glutaminyl-peptide cyclotransferase [Acidobacteria bacterium]|nr:glutaminyl-peptide cyclotransferase [Acidobacteriota bacterium]